MTDRDDGGAGLRALPGNSPIAQLLRVYAEVRASLGGRLPGRGDLGPDRLRELLGWVFLAEWAPPDSIVVRLSGTHIDYVLGTNVTGIDFFDLYTEEARPMFSRFYGHLTDRPCAGYTRRDVIVGGRETFDYHSLYLPLDGPPDRVPIIGAVAVSGFQRLSAAVEAGARPDFRNLSRIGLIDLGDGVPAGGFESVDAAAVCRELDGSGPPRLDDDALMARSFANRPQHRVSLG